MQEEVVKQEARQVRSWDTWVQQQVGIWDITERLRSIVRTLGALVVSMGLLGVRMVRSMGTKGAERESSRRVRVCSAREKKLSSIFKTELAPERVKNKASIVFQFQKFVKTKLEELGIEHGKMIQRLTSEIQQEWFPGQRTRRLMQMWVDKGNEAARVEELELGEGGGKRKKGGHSVLRMHTGLGVRAVDIKKQEKGISCPRNWSG